MRKSIIISVKKGEKPVSHLTPVSLQEAGIREVQDLQKWILEKPEVLGEPLLVLDDQFSKFEGARDRPDILCLDRQGHVVVVELKRTDTADYADLQSLRYAAMLRSLTIDEAARVLSQSHRRREDGLAEDDARKEILEFMAGDDEAAAPGELQNEPRIIIASSGFSKQVLTTVDYLRAHDIDVTCISLSAYSISESHFILVPDVVMPIREIEEYTVRIRKKDEARQSGDRTRRPPMLNYLVENGQLKEGDVLLLKHNLRDEVGSHFKEDDPTFRAAVVIDNGVPSLRWEKDQQLYSPSKLAAKIYREFLPGHPEHVEANGSVAWGTTKESLWAMANRLRGSGPD
jgi:hypothetical protein